MPFLCFGGRISSSRTILAAARTVHTRGDDGFWVHIFENNRNHVAICGGIGLCCPKEEEEEEKAES